MDIRVAVVHLPNSGSTSLVNSLTNSDFLVSRTPCTTCFPQTASTDLDTEITDLLKQQHLHSSGASSGLLQPSITYIDLPGILSQDTRSNEKLQESLQAADVLLFLLRGFEDSSISQYYNRVDPVVELVQLYKELVTLDLSRITQVIQRNIRRKSMEAQQEIKILSGFWRYLTGYEGKEDLLQLILSGNSEIKAAGQPLGANHLNWRHDERSCALKYNLLTSKPAVFFVNVEEYAFLRQRSRWLEPIQTYLKEHYLNWGLPTSCLLLSLAFETRMISLKRGMFQEQQESYRAANPGFLSGLRKVTDCILESMGLIHVITLQSQGSFTCCFCLPRETTALEVSRNLEEEISLGFVAAEVISLRDLLQYGSFEAGRKSAKFRQVGRRHPLDDGDVIQFIYRKKIENDKNKSEVLRW